MLSKAAFLTIFPFASAVALAPRAPPNCGSTNIKWTLSSIHLSSYYTYTSPSSAGPKEGDIDFVFKNDQVDYAISCSGHNVNPQGLFYGFQTYQCDKPKDGSGIDLTTFGFDTASSVFNVTSQWTCGGDVVYQTSASGKADLKCTTTTEKPSPGGIYSNTTTVCEPATLVIQYPEVQLAKVAAN